MAASTSLRSARRGHQRLRSTQRCNVATPMGTKPRSQDRRSVLHKLDIIRNESKEDPSSSSNYSYSEDDESSYEESGGLSSSESSSSAVSSSRKENESEQVLVVAGCKRCLMYFMVAKQVEECPKCNAQLLHFHRTDPIPS